MTRELRLRVRVETEVDLGPDATYEVYVMYTSYNWFDDAGIDSDTGITYLEIHK